jgi:hypothetical protein
MDGRIHWIPGPITVPVQEGMRSGNREYAAVHVSRDVVPALPSHTGCCRTRSGPRPGARGAWCPPTVARGVATGGRQLGPDTPRRPMARWHPAPGSTARAPAGAEVYCSPVRAEGVQTVIQAFGISGEEVWPHLTVEVPRACGISSLTAPATRANGSHQAIMKSPQGRFGRNQNLWIFLTSTGISWRTPRLSRNSAWGGWYRQRCRGGRTRNGR